MPNILKRLICLALILALVLAATGCSGKKSGSKKKGSKKSTAAVTSSDFSDFSSSETDEPVDDEKDEDWEELPEEPPEGELQTLTVQNGRAPTVTNFKGLNYVFHPWGYFTNPNDAKKNYNDSQRKTELVRIEKMGIKSIRAYYGSQLAWDAQQKKYDFNSSLMKEFYTFCLDLQNLGIELAVTANWTLSAFLKDGFGSGSDYIGSFGSVGFGVKDDLAATYRNYRAFMSQTATALQAHGVKNVKYFLGYTECNNTFNEENKDKETILEKRDYERLYPIYDAAITALDAGLKDSGLRQSYKVVAPCDNWRADDGSETYSRLVRYTLQNLADKVDIIGSHRGYDRANEYPDDNYYFIPQENLQECKNEVAAAGKEFWIDEYNVAVQESATSTIELFRQSNNNPFKGTALGALTSSVLNMGAANIYLWALADQQWHNGTNNQEFINGLQIQGYLPSLFVSYTPMKAWYAAGLITKYLGSGKAYYCDEGNAVYTACVQRNDGNWTFVVTNYNAEEVNIKLQLEKSIGGKTLYRHVYDPNTVTPTPDAVLNGVSAVAKNVKTGLYDTVKPYAVYVYTTCNN